MNSVVLDIRHFVVFMSSLSLCGCGYMVGAPFDPEIRTINVPVFKSDSQRRGFEIELTEAVQKEIQSRSHFRLAKGPNADTRLLGEIKSIRKDVLGETTFDDPRELQLTLTVDVTWEDMRNRRILAQRRIPVDSDLVTLQSHSSFAPEIGHSMATAKQAAIKQLARQIVDMMEMQW